MGKKKTLPCNLTEEEKAAAWKQFDGGLLTREEVERVGEILPGYLFFRTDRQGKERDCICSHTNCGRFTMRRKEEPAFFRHKHGDEMRCPKCGGTVKLTSLGRVKTFGSVNRDRWERVTLCRKGEDGALLLMSGYASRVFGWSDLRPLPEVSWKRFTYLKPGKRMQWVRTWEPSDQRCSGEWWWDYRWNESDTVNEPFQPACRSWYSRHDGDSWFLNCDALEETELRYSQVADWMYKEARIFLDAETDPVRNAVKYLAAYTQYPTMEMAVKLGLATAATDLAVDGKKNHRDLNWNATTVHEFLRLGKQDAKTFLHHGGDLALLKAYHRAAKGGSAGNMNEFISAVEAAGLLAQAERLGIACGKTGCSIKTAANYIQRFQSSPERTLTMWVDYLDMATALKYDLSRRDVAMPKDLKERHDAAAETTRYMKVQIDREKHRKYNEKLQKMYEFEYGDLCIVVPQSVEEIVEEGRTLQHCVAGYAARHFQGQLHILFLRHKRKPGTPFVTIEICPRKDMHSKVMIQQIHGYRNEGYLKGDRREIKNQKARPENKYKQFLDLWKDWVSNGSRRDKNGKPVLHDEKEKTA